MRGESGPQRIVAPDDVVNRATKRLDVKGSIEVDDERNVIGGRIRRELIEKPEALLRERQRRP